MQINDTVIIKARTSRYAGHDLLGKMGIIMQIYGSVSCNYAVKIHGMHNSESVHGYFYFSEDELLPISTPVGYPMSTPNTAVIGTIKVNPEKSPLNIVMDDILKQAFKNTISIKKVIFNRPATIVLWSDGTKTIVKRQKGDRWDEEKGLAMCIIKKLSGNEGKYYNIFKRWCNE